MNKICNTKNCGREHVYKESATEAQKVSVTASMDELPEFHSVLYKAIKQGFRHQHDAKRLVQCLANAEAGEHLDRANYSCNSSLARFSYFLKLCCVFADEIVLSFGDGAQGTKVLLNLLQLPFNIKAGRKSDSYSFQRILVPLLDRLTQIDVTSSPHVAEVRMILTYTSEAIFLSQLIGWTESSIDSSGHVVVESDLDNNDRALMPQRACHILLPVLNLLLVLTTKLAPTAIQRLLDEQQIGDYNTRLKRVAARIPPPSLVQQTLERLHNTLQAYEAENYEEASREQAIQQRLDEQKSLHVAQSLQFGMDIPIDEDELLKILPGDANPYNGARHDNDFAGKAWAFIGAVTSNCSNCLSLCVVLDYQEIAILPTHKELMCDKVPFLPRWPCHWDQLKLYQPNRRKAYLDAQFRLLREDTLQEYRNAVRHFVMENSLSRMQPDQVRQTVAISSHSANVNVINLSVYRQVEIESFQAIMRHGLCFTLSFNQITNATDLRGWSVADLWSSGKVLQSNSLVCLIMGAQPIPSAQSSSTLRLPPLKCRQLFFALVSEHNFATKTHEKNSKVQQPNNRCNIEIQLLAPHWQRQLISYMSHSIESNENTERPAVSENVLIELRGHFFQASAAVLSALQEESREVDNPFLQLLVNDALTQPQPNDIATLRGNWMTQPPMYIREAQHISFDLGFLRKSFPTTKSSWRLPINDSMQLYQLLHQQANDLILDDTQIPAFVAGITRQLPLIQGNYC